jgi:2'-hydroxyisoflavone reductase
MGELIGACVEVTGAGARPVWVSDAFLVEQGVGQWTELPLWRTSAGVWAVAPGRAMAAGLVCRPLGDTVADTWAWLPGTRRWSGSCTTLA